MVYCTLSLAVVPAVLVQTLVVGAVVFKTQTCIVILDIQLLHLLLRNTAAGLSGLGGAVRCCPCRGLCSGATIVETNRQPHQSSVADVDTTRQNETL